MKRPLVSFTLAFIAGICLSSRHLSVSYLFLVATGLLCLFGFAFHFKNTAFRWMVLLVICGVFFGFLRNESFTKIPPDDISHFIQSAPVIVTGQIADNPAQTPEQISFTLKAESLNNKNVSGRILVKIYNPQKQYEYGARLRLPTKIISPSPPTNPGQFNYARYLARKRIYCRATLSNDGSVEKISSPQISLLRHPVKWLSKNLIFPLRQRLIQIINKSLPGERKEVLGVTREDALSVLKGVLLGGYKTAPPVIRDAFINSGIVHVLAVSGLHVGLVMIIFYTFFSALRCPRKISSALTIFTVILYALITGARPSAVRAALMCSLGLLANMLGREKDFYNSIAIAGLILLLINPQDLFTVSFQLSFIATLGLLYFAGPLQKFFRFLPRYVAGLLAVTLSAQIVVSPIVVSYFHRLSLIAPLANLLAVPLVTVTVALGFVMIFASFISPVILSVFAHLNWFWIGLLVRATDWFSGFPSAFVRLPTPSLLFLFSFYPLFLLVKYVKGSIWARRAFVGGIVLSLGVYAGSHLLPQKLKITFLALEQKDCILIQTPYRNNALIISRNFLQPDFALGENIISPALWAAGIMSIDKLILTDVSYLYQDELISLVKNFKIKEIITNGQEYRSWEYLKFLKLLQEKKIPIKNVRSPDHVQLDKEVKLQILGPFYLLPENVISDIDNNSLVMKLQYGKFKILFMGNIREINLSPEKLQSNILVFPQQGKYPRAKRLLTCLKPEVGIISGGYGHPELRHQIYCYSTRESGAITIITDGRRYQIKSFLGDIVLNRFVKTF